MKSYVTCYYSNKTYLTELLNGTFHFLGFYKKKSAIFVFFFLWPPVEMKGLTVLTLKKFINLPPPPPSPLNAPQRTKLTSDYSVCPFQLCGENAITHSTTVVCNCGSCKTTDVHCVSRSGSYKGLAVDILSAKLS